ncbi:MAG: hypothetical protein GHHEDOFH_01556 [Pseudorhodoplanes sp.]|nr:hypothetical protein [Pseudorhodoplanes sp.]
MGRNRIGMIRTIIRVDAEELRIWRERHPREALAVAEEARARIEGREPNYGPAQVFG